LSPLNVSRYLLISYASVHGLPRLLVLVAASNQARGAPDTAGDESRVTKLIGQLFLEWGADGGRLTVQSIVLRTLPFALWLMTMAALLWGRRGK
jgi:hypothetical protein